MLFGTSSVTMDKALLKMHQVAVSPVIPLQPCLFTYHSAMTGLVHHHATFSTASLSLASFFKKRLHTPSEGSENGNSSQPGNS